MTSAALVGGTRIDVLSRSDRERHAPGEELDAASADPWAAWSSHAAARVLPLLHDLQAVLPGLQSALVCTADGFGLCALGLDDGTLRRVSAMASSLTSLAAAATDPAEPAPASSEGPDTSLALVTLVHGTSITVVLPVRLGHDDLLLSVSVSGPTLGSLLHHAELTSDRIRAALA